MRQLQQQQKEFRELRLLRIDVKTFTYFTVLNCIKNAKSSEERKTVHECWEKASGVPLGKGKAEGKGKGKAEGSKAQSTTP
jgi:hypothetical protein